MRPIIEDTLCLVLLGLIVLELSVLAAMAGIALAG